MTLIGAVVVLVNVSLTIVVPLAAAWLMPATSALVHVNVAPAVALVAVYPKAAPLQIAAGVSVLLSTGIGLTVSTTFCPALLHPLAVVT